jgi:hypothetical protein
VDPGRTVANLVEIAARGSCTDAERRAARLLSRALRDSGRRPRTETVWVRPQWSWIWLLHAALGIAGSVVSVDAPVVGLVIAAVAAVSAIAQLTGRVPVLALLWPRRATQNVVSRDTREARVRLVITAPYDAPRAMTGTLRAASRADTAMRRLLRGRWPHPLALLTLALVALTGCAIARVAGVEESRLLGALQLIPTVVCIVAVALLADLAFGRVTPGASAHASAGPPRSRSSRRSTTARRATSPSTSCWRARRTARRSGCGRTSRSTGASCVRRRWPCCTSSRAAAAPRTCGRTRARCSRCVSTRGSSR